MNAKTVIVIVVFFVCVAATVCFCWYHHQVTWRLALEKGWTEVGIEALGKKMQGK